MDFDNPGAGFTGIKIILPAGFTSPPAAQHALPEFGYRMRRTTEITGILRKTMGVLDRGLPLLAHNRDLFSYVLEEI
jgi:hypothetical protein